MQQEARQVSKAHAHPRLDGGLLQEIIKKTLPVYPRAESEQQ